MVLVLTPQGGGFCCQTPPAMELPGTASPHTDVSQLFTTELLATSHFPHFAEPVQEHG